MILFLVVFSLALSGAQGAPSTAVYKFVKCNPEGDQANCITHQSANMEWSPDLPTKLPASAAQYLEAEPVEDERDPEEEEDPVEEDPMEEEEDPVEEEEDPVEEEEDPVEEEEEALSPEEGESPLVYLTEDGSGDGGSGFMADVVTPADDDSGKLLDKPNRGGRTNRKWALMLGLDEQKTSKEMMEEHLLHQ